MADSSSNNTAKNDAAVSSVADQLASTKLSADEENEVVDLHVLSYLPTQNKDCLVCMVPLPIDSRDFRYWPCCGMNICFACEFEQVRALNVRNIRRNKEELPKLVEVCAFCRTSASYFDNMTEEEKIRCIEERIRKGDAAAAHCLGSSYWSGVDNLEKNKPKALEYFQRASDLGCRVSIRQIALLHATGDSGMKKNRIEAERYFAEAVKRGDAVAHYLVGVYQILGDGNTELAIQHWRLAAEGGYVESMKKIWKEFYDGNISKDALEATLRRHKEACDEMDSEERKRYRAYREARAGGDDVLKAVYHKYYRGEINAKQLKELIK